MPTPVSIVASGGLPIVDTSGGVPMTPVTAPVYGKPVTLVTDVDNIGAKPVTLVNDDLSDWVG